MSEKIRIMVDPALRGLLPQYLENRIHDLETLRAAAQKSDFKTMQIIGHKIRGHAVSYGFNQLGSICALIERAAIEKKLEIIISQLNEYRDYIEKVELS